MTWNKKNRQFALSCRLRPSSEKLAQWILDRVYRYSTTTKLFDLKQFNEQIASYRPKGAFDPKTIKEAIAQLDESTHGWIEIVGDHNWHLKTLLVRPVEDVIRKKSEARNLSARRLGGNPEFSVREREKRDLLLQHNISKLDLLLQKVNLKYGVTSLKRIWKYAQQKFDEVERAIELMLYQNSVSPESVKNPKGWLIGCLKGKWYETFDLHYSPDLPKALYLRHGRQRARIKFLIQFRRSPRSITLLCCRKMQHNQSAM